MGKIIINGEEYSGTRDSATSVNYDNSVSGLNAGSVQEGIDELVEGLKNTSPVDNLLSTSTKLPLSANQGRILNDSLEMIRTDLANNLSVYHNKFVAILVFNAFRVDSTMPGWVTIGTLPENIKNSQLVRGVITDNGATAYSNSNMIPIVINNNGEIVTYLFEDKLSVEMIGQVVYPL